MSEPLRSTLSPAPSPTGTPVIPTRLVPYALFLTSALLLLAEALEEGPMSTARWIRLVVGILTLAVGASPGLRRHGGQLLVLVAVGLTFQGCAPVRLATYAPKDCQGLRREARRAGAYRVGASSVAAGLAAGGAVAELVTESKGAQVGLALGAVLFGAVGLAAGWYGDDATREWQEECPGVEVPLGDVARFAQAQ